MRGLTQSELARAADVDQSHVAVLESGFRQPSAQVLSSLARVLELPASYFRQPVRAYLSGGTLRYRAKADLGKRAANRIRGEAEHLLDIVMSLSDRVNRVPMRLHPTTGGHPAGVARDLRRLMRPDPTGPLPHLIRNFEKLGGIVVALGPEERFDAFAEWGGRLQDLPIIAIADGVPPDRLRMNVAHEIGHLVLHKDSMIAQRVAEREAFEFASALLMPPESIARDFESVGTEIDAFVGLKGKWGVSVQALVRCARSLGRVSERHYRTLNARIARLGWKYDEPPEADRFAERPLAVRRMAEVAFGSPLPYPTMEKSLHVPESQLRRFFSRYLASSTPSPAQEESPTSRSVH
jgi:Zn-dependent peptidase ImmA (M78 family)/transcriptional regulator with XRE-family HTH domain